MTITLNGTTGITSPAETLNRTGSNGVIQTFQKDGLVAGIIGSAANDLMVGNGAVGLRFNDQTTQIYAYDTSTVANSDGLIDIGRTTARFKDLYLSGGVYVGGTGSANYLDDYEEGSWTPTLTGQFTQNSWDTVTSINLSHARYTKIGEMVTLYFAGGFVGANGFLTVASNITIGGLPYTAIPRGDAAFNSDQAGGTFHVYNSLGQGYFATGAIMSYQGDITLTVTALSYSSMTATSEVYFTHTYRTAS